jgi:hypothetical protein
MTEASDDDFRGLLEYLRGSVSALFGIAGDRLDPFDLPQGQMLTWPVAGTPGVGE